MNIRRSTIHSHQQMSSKQDFLEVKLGGRYGFVLKKLQQVLHKRGSGCDSMILECNCREMVDRYVKYLTWVELRPAL